jgi:hypothetical protein
MRPAILNVSSTYLNQKPGFNIAVAKAFFPNYSMNKLAITGYNGLPIGAAFVCSYRISPAIENMSWSNIVLLYVLCFN